jgi:hypothetical protein
MTNVIGPSFNDNSGHLPFSTVGSNANITTIRTIVVIDKGCRESIVEEAAFVIR